jgi:hypothetical protein
VSHLIYCYAGCRNAECHYAECPGALARNNYLHEWLLGVAKKPEIKIHLLTVFSTFFGAKNVFFFFSFSLFLNVFIQFSEIFFKKIFYSESLIYISSFKVPFFSL